MKSAILLCLLMAIPMIGGAQGVDTAMDLYHYGKFQNAADIFSRLSLQDPKDAKLHIWLGRTFLKLRRWDAAIVELEKAVNLEPKNGETRLWLARAYGNKAAHVFVLRAFGWATKTRQEFETAAQLSPDNVDIRFDLLEFYVQAPGIVGGGKAKAEEQAREIARLKPRAGHTARAAIYESDKRWDQARRELTEATLKFPNDADGFVDLADFLLRRNDFEAAEATAKKALAIEGSIRSAKMLLAAAQVQLRRNVPGALTVLQELASGPLAERDPGFEDVHFWLGQAFLAQGSKQEARQAFEASLRFDPEQERSKQARDKIK
jgi:tetratricopeptide (TPR) repeat protein